MATKALAYPIKVGLIGHGAIGSVVAIAVMNSTHGLDKTRIKLIAILTKNPRSEETIVNFSNNNILLTTNPEDFFSTEFDVCVEAAGQPAVREHGEQCLLSGRNFLCTLPQFLLMNAKRWQCSFWLFKSSYILYI